MDLEIKVLFFIKTYTGEEKAIGISDLEAGTSRSVQTQPLPESLGSQKATPPSKM
jgi:hypothetical protein